MKRVAASLVSLALLLSLSFAQSRVKDQIYLKQGGAAFTLDVFKPAKPNGMTIVHLVSGGWVSDHSQINSVLADGANSMGFTVVQVVHGAQPRYKVPEVVQQVRRAIRFVRANAAEYGIDPNRIGVTGGSAGGHLSLMIGALGDDGNPTANDPVEKASSRVQAIGIFFPPTDFTNYGGPGIKGMEVPALRIGFGNAFVPDINTASKEKMEELSKQLSPALLFTKSMPPTLLVHGDQDKLVPIQQSQLAIEKLTALGVPCKLITVPGKEHGWPEMGVQYLDILNWFRQYLKG